MKSALAVLLALLPGTALSETNSWFLSSLNAACTITVSRDEDGQLTYGVFRQAKPVILKSPLGLRRDDENFDKGLAFEEASRGQSSRAASHSKLFSTWCDRNN